MTRNGIAGTRSSLMRINSGYILDADDQTDRFGSLTIQLADDTQTPVFTI